MIIEHDVCQEEACVI